MKLHTCVITYNRIDLSQQAVDSYLKTVTLPYTIIVVDNGSSDGTEEWLREWVAEGDNREILLLGRNMYPGYACNRGFEKAPSDATHFHRLDNDFRLLPGWCEEAKERFTHDVTLGQLGLRTDIEEHYARDNVGGNFVITRDLWEKGLRFDERPWGEYPPGYAECSLYSVEVGQLGYHWKRSQTPVIENMATGDWNDPYYQETFGIRDIRRPADDRPGTD